VTTLFDLDVSSFAIGTPLSEFGVELAVVAGRHGQKCLGLNGVQASQAIFRGHTPKDFECIVTADFNLPIDEGQTFSAQLLSLKLSDGLVRTVDITLSQEEAAPPQAFFSLAGPPLAPQKPCTNVAVPWKTNKLTTLKLDKASGSLRIFYNDRLLCGSPIAENQALREFSVFLGPAAKIYDVMIRELSPAEMETPLPVTASTAPPAQSGSPSATPPAGSAPATAASGSPTPAPGATTAPGATATTQPPPTGDQGAVAPLPAAPPRWLDEPGMTRFDLRIDTPGAVLTSYGDDVVVRRDNEGKYLAAPTQREVRVRYPVKGGKDFKLDVIISNVFDLNIREGYVGRYNLFNIRYKNGVTDYFTINLFQDESFVWQSRYSISSVGPSSTDRANTNFFPWDNGLNFNNYTVIKSPGMIKFFSNGEFVRTEPSQGDEMVSVEMPLRYNERLYNVIVRDTTPHPTPPSADQTGATAPAPASAPAPGAVKEAKP